MSKSTVVYVGLGSNHAQAPEYLARAREGLAALANVSLRKASPVYLTEPQEYTDQPWFHNQVLELAVEDTVLPRRLMENFLALESRLGRVRSPDPALRYGPRCIDIDMLLFGDLVSDDPVCLLPHPRLAVRAFWLVPLRDMAPNLVIGGESLQSLLARLDWHGEKNKIWQ